jgi:mRNA-degrading endonuclease RelE of RelBE toxin-antitoxin system
MTYEIIPTNDFISDFKKLDSHLQKKIKKKFDEVAENPVRYKHMSPPWNNYCRIRIEKLRIIFRYNVETKKLYLNKIVFKHKY